MSATLRIVEDDPTTAPRPADGAFGAAPTAAGVAVAQLSLRAGLAYVFLIFGSGKLVDWRGWATMLPPEVAHRIESSGGLDLPTLMHLLGYVEVILGLHLAFGFFTRGAAAVSAVILALAVLVMGSTGIGVRDAGLLSAAVAVAFAGGGSWSLDAWLSSRQTAGAPGSVSS
jgi:uncharacterized membrane protein YphA (DoxX/SURF4 family)